jgi:hypothetical protein
MGGLIYGLRGVFELLVSTSAEDEYKNYQSWKTSEKISYNFGIMPNPNGLNAALTVRF